MGFCKITTNCVYSQTHALRFHNHIEHIIETIFNQKITISKLELNSHSGKSTNSRKYRHHFEPIENTHKFSLNFLYVYGSPNMSKTTTISNDFKVMTAFVTLIACGIRKSNLNIDTM